MAIISPRRNYCEIKIPDLHQIEVHEGETRVQITGSLQKLYQINVHDPALTYF